MDRPRNAPSTSTRPGVVSGVPWRYSRQRPNNFRLGDLTRQGSGTPRNPGPRTLIFPTVPGSRTRLETDKNQKVRRRRCRGPGTLRDPSTPAEANSGLATSETGQTLPCEETGAVQGAGYTHLETRRGRCGRGESLILLTPRNVTLGSFVNKKPTVLGTIRSPTSPLSAPGVGASRVPDGG